MSQQHKRHSENSNNNNNTNSSSNKSNSTRRNHENAERSSGSHSKGFQIQQAKLRDLATNSSDRIQDDLIVGESYKFCKHGGSGSGGRGGDSVKRSSQKYMDSGKSSDSSLSSANNYRKIQEGGSLRIGSAHSKGSNKYNPDSAFRMLQESSSAHNIPDRNAPSIVPSISNSSDIASSNKSPSHSTPLMKKRMQYEGQSSSKSRESSSKAKQHQSLDFPGPSVSITRSGSFMSPVHTGPKKVQQRKGSFEGHASDDSMHEKYFKSVENTPVSRRRHTSSAKTGLKSSDSSPQSPIISPQHYHHHHHQNQQPPAPQQKSVRPSHLGLESLTKKSSHKYDPDMVNMDIAVKHDR